MTNVGAATFRSQNRKSFLLTLHFIVPKRRLLAGVLSDEVAVIPYQDVKQFITKESLLCTEAGPTNLNVMVLVPYLKHSNNCFLKYYIT